MHAKARSASPRRFGVGPSEPTRLRVPAVATSWLPLNLGQRQALQRRRGGHEGSRYVATGLDQGLGPFLCPWFLLVGDRKDRGSDQLFLLKGKGSFLSCRTDRVRMGRGAIDGCQECRTCLDVVACNNRVNTKTLHAHYAWERKGHDPSHGI